MSEQDIYVWFPEERVYAKVLHWGAYVSQIEYSKDGTDYHVIVENNEVEYIGGFGDYED